MLLLAERPVSCPFLSDTAHQVNVGSGRRLAREWSSGTTARLWNTPLNLRGGDMPGSGIDRSTLVRKCPDLFMPAVGPRAAHHLFQHSVGRTHQPFDDLRG